MATIIGSERRDDHILLSVRVGLDEARSLKDMVGEVSILHHDAERTDSSIYERGRKGATKYFLIPKAARKDILLNNSVSVMKIDTEDKLIWSFFMDKFKTR